MSNVKAAAIARKKMEEGALDAENLKLYKRLQAVNPSSDVDRDKLQSQYAAARSLRDKLTTKRVVRQHPPGVVSPVPDWTDRW